MGVRDRLKDANRIVVKVGTSTLAYGPGRLNLLRMERLVREIVDLANQGKEVLLVSSGAIAAGLGRIGSREKPASIPQKQAVAAIGQGMLMHVYEKIFSEYGKVTGQVLLTKENAVRYHQYIHSRNALLALLGMGVIPVINENDAVAVDEIRIGDNDSLSAMVATLVDADALILLSDIDGLYTANPQQHADAKIMDEVAEITPDIERIAGGSGSRMGTGGMITKIDAAKVAMSAGVTMVIAQGSQEGILHRILSGDPVGTLFPAKPSHLKLRKSWLAFGKQLDGDILVDEGCVHALKNQGSSILAAGVVDCEGDFAAGNTVRVLGPNKQEIARGIVNYNTVTLKRILGRQTKEFSDLIQGEIHEEVIHRDNMVLMV